MVVTADVYLPPEEELTVQEVNLSGPALRAGAFQYGKYCEFENNVRVIIFSCRRTFMLHIACFHQLLSIENGYLYDILSGRALAF